MIRKIRVLIVDDSAIVRKILTECLGGEPDIEVVGTAPDPLVAEEKIPLLAPDVLTLDIEMPRMDGLSYLKKLMHTRPLPVIVISSVAAKGCAAALHAIEYGAVEVLGKPSGPYSVGDLKLTLAQKVRSAASARLRRSAPPVVRAGISSAARPLPRIPPGAMIGIGASTGGTEAIRSVLQGLPETVPPILIVQHIPPVFSRAFADRLNATCAMRVKEAEAGDRLEPGLALIAPGDFHMTLDAHRRCVDVKSGPRVCYQRPAVDVLFHSMAQAGAGRTIAVLMTGMGSDGARGLLALREAGAHTIGQDEQSCVVYGMPREAARIGAVEQVLSLDRIPAAICRLLSAEQPAAASAAARSL